MTVLDYLRPRLFEHLGHREPDLGDEPTGHHAWRIRAERPHGGHCAFRPALPPKGQWQGRQLVPAAWVEAATARQPNGSNRRAIGIKATATNSGAAGMESTAATGRSDSSASSCRSWMRSSPSPPAPETCKPCSISSGTSCFRIPQKPLPPSGIAQESFNRTRRLGLASAERDQGCRARRRSGRGRNSRFPPTMKRSKRRRSKLVIPPAALALQRRRAADRVRQGEWAKGDWLMAQCRNSRLPRAELGSQ